MGTGNRCVVGLILGTSCSQHCNTGEFNWPAHGMKDGCFRCGEGNHKLNRCYTRFGKQRNVYGTGNAKNDPFPKNTCGVCGLRFKEGYGPVIGSTYFTHDANKAQVCQPDYRIRSGRCSSGLQDIFYKLLYVIYYKETGKLLLYSTIC